ncbi:aspartate aminotransferase family protein [Acidisoma cellulosilytica]|uniref:Aspartate aminotransferase family protein n=1 Tax=Acidisoma cellulosilyticum TaxID=2802395 RepID=A0A963Z175_9PROT|nr:aminotransferase class V-fold PLP-dependent enzyme [Acidisoma cellulosilyticum]MCB8879938.1 aspartate aminotransferase family protein [Acidisoma cellulosilyticum]
MEPTPADRALREAADRAIAYLHSVRDRPVTASPEALRRLDDLRHPLPQSGLDASAVISRLDEIGSPATTATAGGRYFGLVIGGALPATVAASWLAAAWDQNACFRATSPIAATLEDVALTWLIDLFGLPSGTAGGFVTGASMANVTALAAARHAILARQGWDVEAKGLYGAPELRVIVSDEVHVTVLKALSLLGLGRDRVIRVPTDTQGRMRIDALPALDDHTILCIQAGNVNTGAFDPAAEICLRAKKAGAWVHVDGAFGLWAIANPAMTAISAGFAEADSWATDGHKWLNVPYDSGIVFVRNPADLREAMAATAVYHAQGEAGGREPAHYTPESSRRARGVEIWAALLNLGRDGISDLIDRTCRHARAFAQALQDEGYDILNDVVLNQVLVSFGSPEETRAVIARIQADGICWCGGTVWQGRTAMRISVCNWSTTDADVQMSIAAMLSAGRQVVSTSRPGT